MDTQGMRDALFARLKENYNDYRNDLLQLDRQELVDKAERIAETAHVFKHLTEDHQFEENELEYLLQFQSPLEVVTDHWMDYELNLDVMDGVIWDACDKQADVTEYPLIKDKAARDEPTHLRKFVNIDILASLDAVMRRHTESYQSDFQIDKEIIRKAAQSTETEDKTLLWMSRPGGTYCFKERDMFLRDTRAHNSWRFYHEQTKDKVLAYTVEISGWKGDKIVGNLCELDYQQHAEHVRRASLPVFSVLITRDDGKIRQVPYEEYRDNPDVARRATGIRYEPEDESVHLGLLRREQARREQLKTGNFKIHLQSLTDSLIQAEADRIVSEFGVLIEPNSPNKTHYMVQLSPGIDLLYGSREIDTLLDMLPYKSLSMSGLKGEKGLWLMVSKDENRDQTLLQKKASVKQQLKEAQLPVPSDRPKPREEVR
jgi:hypothetical protein